MALGLVAACLPAAGWEHTDRRACEPGSAPIVCLSAQAEGPYELRVGERVLLPGECMQGPPDAGRGRLRVVLHAAGRALAHARLALREGTRTTVIVEDDRVRVVDQQRCDGRVPSP